MDYGRLLLLESTPYQLVSEMPVSFAALCCMFRYSFAYHATLLT